MAPRSLVCVLFACVLAGVLAAPAAAQEPVRAGRLHVIGPTPERQYYRTFPELFSITRAGDGFLAASWVSGNSGEEIVRLRRLDDDGVPIAPEASFGAYGLEDMRLAGDATGAWIVHSRWTADNVSLQRLTPSGVHPDVLGQATAGRSSRSSATRASSGPSARTCDGSAPTGPSARACRCPVRASHRSSRATRRCPAAWRSLRSRAAPGRSRCGWRRRRTGSWRRSSRAGSARTGRPCPRRCSSPRASARSSSRRS